MRWINFKHNNKRKEGKGLQDRSWKATVDKRNEVSKWGAENMWQITNIILLNEDRGNVSNWGQQKCVDGMKYQREKALD